MRFNPTTGCAGQIFTGHGDSSDSRDGTLGCVRAQTNVVDDVKEAYVTGSVAGPPRDARGYVPQRMRERRRPSENQRASVVLSTLRRGVGRRPAVPTSFDNASASAWWIAELKTHRALVSVLLLYVVAAAVVPIFAPVPVGDDWVYSRSVEILVREGRLHVLDLSVVTLVFQVIWGSLFSLLFGLSFGAMRLSTVVLTFLSGITFYALCRELAVDRTRSALGAALYLFNPLAFVLSFTFMTDPHFSAWLIGSTLFYVRGFRPDDPSRQAILVGSTLAACAFLVRQQGALIPVAVITYLVISRRIGWNRPSLGRVRDVAAIPVIAGLGYYAWLLFLHGVPEQQGAFLQQILAAGWHGTWQLIRFLTYIEAVYIGFIVLPITIGALAGLRQLLSLSGWWRWNFVAAWASMLGIGLIAFALGPAHFTPIKMPYLSQFVGMHGVGPADLLGGRNWLVENGGALRDWLTWISAASSLVVAIALAGRLGKPDSAPGVGAGLCATMAIWQAVGVFPPSYHFRTWIISVDRYLLPLLPFGVLILLWSLRGTRVSMPVAWTLIAIIGFYSTLAARDFLVFQEATWDMARYANETVGVPLTKLDAGASWDGYHLYEFSVANDVPQQTPSGPWWTDLFGPTTDSTFVVSTSSAVPRGYQAIAWTEYSSWLNTRPVYLFLMQRIEVAPSE
jgi:hypothetical protein